MARPRKFEEDRAVEAAMRAFWRVGYEATSTEDLCAATGLGRSSIYNAFSSKHELFEQALRRYMAQRTGALLELLDGDRPIREKLRVVLWWAVDPTPDDPLGCLVVNSIVELAPHDPPIAALLRRDQEQRLTALRTAIAAGQRAGEIAPDRDPLALAHFVVATIQGMQVAARAGADRDVLAAIATTALGAF